MRLEKSSVADEIERCVVGVINRLSLGGLEPITLTITASKEWTNGETIPLGRLTCELEKSISKFTQLMRLLEIVYQNLGNKCFVTTRDIYYSDVNLFKNQRAVDSLIKTLCTRLSIPRSYLNITASPKGLLFGNIEVNTDSSQSKCSINSGACISVPCMESTKVTKLKFSFKYIIIVEKECSFHTIRNTATHSFLASSLLITAKGYPDINTKTFLRMLADDTNIPMLFLTDCDPYGIEIFYHYIIGLKDLPHMKGRIRYLGLLPSDLNQFSVSRTQQMQLTSKDIHRATSLKFRLEFSRMDPEVIHEVNEMLKVRKKAELQCLTQETSCTTLVDFIELKISSPPSCIKIR